MSEILTVLLSVGIPAFIGVCLVFIKKLKHCSCVTPCFAIDILEYQRSGDVKMSDEQKPEIKKCGHIT